jgi:hypothetical protein
VLVNVSATEAFAYLSDAKCLGEWSIGCMNTTPTKDAGVYMGDSFLTGSRSWVSIDARPELLLIDYRTGSPGNLVARISVRVIPGENCDLGSQQCYVCLTAWRPATMDDDRWRALCSAHELEIWLIQQNIERRA